MKLAKKALFGATTAFALSAFYGLAIAKDVALHTMTVQSPDGGTVTIRYSGDVAPKVAFGPAPQMVGFTDYDSPFAMMQRISSEMDRRMAAMMSQANAMMAHLPDANPTIPANFWNMPMNLPGLSAIAAGGKGSFCMKSVEITSDGDGKSPHVVTHTAGDCAGGSASAHATGGKGPKNTDLIAPLSDRAAAGSPPGLRRLFYARTVLPHPFCASGLEFSLERF